MSAERDFEFELFLQYYGDADQVKKIINDCNICGNKLVLVHNPDYSNMVLHEAASCPECGNKKKNLICVIN